MKNPIGKATFIALLGSLPVLAGSGWFTHITAKGSGIRSEIVLTNNSKNPTRIFLNPSDANSPVVVEIDPGQTVTLDAHTLQNDKTPVAIYADCPSFVHAWLRYSGEALTSPLLVPPAEDPAEVIRFDVPRGNALWYGLALVNAGDAPARVSLAQYGPNRELLFETTLTDALAVHDKLLSAISQLPFEPVADSYFEVISSEPVAALHLSAAQDAKGKLQLAQEMPLNKVKDMVRFTATGGFAPLQQIIEVAGGLLCRSVSLDAHMTRECAKIPPERLAQFEDLIADLDLLDLEVVLVEVPQGFCADIPLIRVELYKDGSENSFEYDLCDLPSRSNSAAVMAFEAEIYALAASLLDPE